MTLEGRRIKILSIEDDPKDQMLLQRALVENGSALFDLVSAVSIADAIVKISESRFDLILLDLTLPDSRRAETLARVRSSALDSPIVIMTDLADEKSALEALGNGAQDYLVKSQVDGSSLSRAVRYAIQHRRFQEALKISQERYDLAVQGSLDGLWDWDLRKDRIFFSERWKSILGYAHGEIGSEPEEWLSRIHQEDAEGFKFCFQEHIVGRTSCIDLEYRIKNKAGDWRWMSVRGVAARDGQGRAYRMAGSQADVTDRKAAEERLLHNASHDLLTGLPGRSLIMKSIHQAIKRLERIPDYVFAVMFLDLDRFKLVNDSLGHTQGDELLVEVSRRLQAHLRGVDTIARIGGDEFIIVTDNMKNDADAIRVAERIKKALESSFDLEGHEVFVRVSIGIALSSPEYKTAEEMVRDADTAMYRTKALGGGGHQLFNQNMHINAVELLDLENKLRRAVGNGDFVLHYQPVVSLKTGSLVGMEALIRWMHPEKGMLLPGEFIHLAEETGLIVTLGEWVLKSACVQLSRWQKEFSSAAALSVSVNVSFKQFIQVGFVDSVERAVKEAGIAPGSLCLEITESGVMKNPDMIIPLLSQLKKRSIQIHLDDFGTGYSSLYYLHQFKIDKLKIDRSFVSNIQHADGNFEVLKSIIQLAHNLKIETIAEGIETPEQVERLQKLGCQYGQGYFISKPKDSEEITKLIAQASKVRQVKR